VIVFPAFVWATGKFCADTSIRDKSRMAHKTCGILMQIILFARLGGVNPESATFARQFAADRVRFCLTSSWPLSGLLSGATLGRYTRFFAPQILRN
jgi:hypothetical protein